MYSAQKTPTGSYQIFNNGQLISTGSAESLGNYGLSPDQLSSGTGTTAIANQTTPQPAQSILTPSVYPQDGAPVIGTPVIGQQPGTPGQTSTSTDTSTQSSPISSVASAGSGQSPNIGAPPTTALSMAGITAPSVVPGQQTATNPYNAVEQGIQGVQAQVQQLAQAMPAALAALQANGGTAPQSAGQAGAAVGAAVQSVTDTSGPDPITVASSDLTQGYTALPPALQMIYGLIQNVTSPSATAQTFQQQYQNLVQSSGLQADQLQYMNIQNVMNGTTNDIRNEITAAGGLATESQVQSMSATRNQTLVLQANQLQNAMSIAQDYVNQTMQFSEADQQQVNTSLNQKIGLVETAASMQTTMDATAAGNYNKTLTALGDNYTAFASTIPSNMQPYVEQVMGLARGTLSNPTTLANMTTAALKQQNLQIAIEKEQIAAQNAQSAAILRSSQANYYGARSTQATDSAINSTISQLYPTSQANPINTYQVSAQQINRLDNAYTLSTSATNPSKSASDLDLIDSYIQIVNGGRQVTESQVGTLLSGSGIKATWDVNTQKLTGLDTILNDQQRKTIYNIAHNTFSGQETNANTAVTRINDQLQQQGFDPTFNLPTPQSSQAPQTGQSIVDPVSGNTYIVGQTYNDGTNNWTIDANGNWSKQ